MVFIVVEDFVVVVDDFVVSVVSDVVVGNVADGEVKAGVANENNVVSAELIVVVV
jgi:hypothetical protein